MRNANKLKADDAKSEMYEGVTMLKKYRALSPAKATDSVFQPLWDLHASLCFDLRICDHVLLVKNAYVVPKNYKNAFYSERLSPKIFYFWEKWVDDI